MPINIVLNGQSRSFESLGESPSVDALVQELGLKSDRVAIERNGEIVPRTTWAQVSLIEGDRVEMVHFVGGGC
ncbi:MAG: sulfur carrier protein ThiS [Edaphobacter sp.]|uniref:sulfur carrier protein ThiS n=1 Tax=Edaphobacter sp. TaxID=1934404 RepID=UPI00238A350D|nr:sulfur carrier protein ThiS [Edaphobacter sp.]MDE1175359.1 sulfur carrier protein ThiS [Edaphobacter sp.]